MEDKSRKEGETREDAPERKPEVIDPEPEPRIIRVASGGIRPRNDRFRPAIRSEVIESEPSGNLIGRIYETETHTRDLLYKFELVRAYSTENGTGQAFNFGLSDCRHGIHCFKWAQDWLYRRERWLKRPAKRRFF